VGLLLKKKNNIDQLVPKTLYNEKPKASKEQGFVEENLPSDWKKKVGEAWMTVQGYIGKVSEMNKKYWETGTK